MFLDSESSLLLRRSEDGADTFQRIGIARFLRTDDQQAQLKNEGKDEAWIVTEKNSWGPINVVQNLATVKIV
jgi:hypothetical protein